MGLTPRAQGSIRFSLGIYNTAEEVDYVLKHLPGIIGKLRAVSRQRSENGSTESPTPKTSRRRRTKQLICSSRGKWASDFFATVCLKTN